MAKNETLSKGIETLQDRIERLRWHVGEAERELCQKNRLDAVVLALDIEERLSAILQQLRKSAEGTP